jgi:ribosomal-protein-alanine N-acetyltransferase
MRLFPLLMMIKYRHIHRRGFYFMSIPTLETEHLILRPLRENDLDDLYEYANDPAVYEHGMWRPYKSRAVAAADLAELLEEYTTGRLWWWALQTKADAKMIGRCEIARVQMSVGRAENGYALNQHYWGKGFASEAIQCVLTYGFDEMKLNRIAAEVLTDNAVSIHLLEKMGFKREGTLRQETKIRGYLEDIHIYGILKSEWYAH